MHIKGGDRDLEGYTPFNMDPIELEPTTFKGKLKKLVRDVIEYRRIIFLTAVVNFGSL